MSDYSTQTARVDALPPNIILARLSSDNVHGVFCTPDDAPLGVPSLLIAATRCVHFDKHFFDALHDGKFDESKIPNQILFQILYAHYERMRDEARDDPNLLAEGFLLKPGFILLNRFLQLTRFRKQLHRMIQYTVDWQKKNDFIYLNYVVSDTNLYVLHSIENCAPETSDEQLCCIITYLITVVTELAFFLFEAGWYEVAKEIMDICEQRLFQYKWSSASLSEPLHRRYTKVHFEALTRFAQIALSNCDYECARLACEAAEEIYTDMVNKWKPSEVCNPCMFFIIKSGLAFSLSDYTRSHDLAKTALANLDVLTPPTIVVDVLRYCTKVCVVKRQFQQSDLLVKFLMKYTKKFLGEEHLKYADVMLEYAFHLLHLDFVVSAVKIHRKVLAVRQSTFFSEHNALVAMAHEDLAYALYVSEYNTGKFDEALGHSCTGLNMMESLVNKDHFLLSSGKRVKALILEEIALEAQNNFHTLFQDVPPPQLIEAEALHVSSLTIAQRVFGELNLQTAKHYGNLGRLYQSMKRFQEAEENHLRAIEIKEKLMGPEDYEVALSVGHLASLYNYDMKEYAKAEKLYLRAIGIGERLFGRSYSGLEYDYRGLIKLYTEMQNHDKRVEYTSRLHEWQTLRTQHEDQDQYLTSNDEAAARMSLKRLIEYFFELEKSKVLASETDNSQDLRNRSAAT